jgi:myo-inositol-1(or 4)-monophosphatase
VIRTQAEAHVEPRGASVADLERIERTLRLVAHEVAVTDMQRIEVTHAGNGDPTTTLDRKINEIIRETLPQRDEGWLSEETRDNEERLGCERVWIVDPIDGTREFVRGIPEWSVSIGLAVNHEPVAGGVLNPCTGELFLGSTSASMRLVHVLGLPLAGRTDERACLSVSRREHKDGKWLSFEGDGRMIRPIGSIAYRLARVAAGLDSATCTFDTRSEWDVAAGVALVRASGGRAETMGGRAIRFNNESPKLTSLFAFAKNCPAEIVQMFADSLCQGDGVTPMDDPAVTQAG